MPSLETAPHPAMCKSSESVTSQRRSASGQHRPVPAPVGRQRRRSPPLPADDGDSGPARGVDPGPPDDRWHGGRREHISRSSGKGRRGPAAGAAALVHQLGDGKLLRSSWAFPPTGWSSPCSRLRWPRCSAEPFRRCGPHWMNRRLLCIVRAVDFDLCMSCCPFSTSKLLPQLPESCPLRRAGGPPDSVKGQIECPSSVAAVYQHLGGASNHTS